MSDKELILEALKKLPDDATMEAIQEEVAILAELQRREGAAGKGKTISHEEAVKRLAAWKPSKSNGNRRR